MKNLLISLRPQQWIKNLFVLLPLIFGGKLLSYPANLTAAAAVFLFSIASGVVYLINDLMDLERDRSDPAKRIRPVASGKITPVQAAVAALILGALCAIGAFALNAAFGWIIIAYWSLNLLYSARLKEVVILDVFCIGGFFMLRILAGGAVAQVALSHWILFSAGLLALFLGFNKRRQELVHLGEKSVQHRKVLRRYSAYFIDQLIGAITASIVIVYMLYTVDEATVVRVGSSRLIYSIPFVYYGIFRYLYLIHERRGPGDPTQVLLSDRTLQLNILAWLAVCIAVIYLP